jgi:hypothetical protein
MCRLNDNVLTFRSDRVFFVYLRGYLPKSKKELALLDEGLVDATLSVSGSIVYPDGSYMEPRSFTIPLKTISINDAAHFVIRDSNGTHLCIQAVDDIYYSLRP